MSRPALLHVVITGLMGSGKSTVGPIVAERLGRPWSDSDAAIEREAGQTGREVALAEGVPSLHAMEAAHLLAALKEPTPAVICAAPSVLEDTKCLEALERGAATLFLDVAPAELETRQTSGEHRRSLAAPLTTLMEMRHHRLEAVRAVGGAVVECGGAAPARVADLVLQALAAPSNEDAQLSKAPTMDCSGR